jgi:DNA modification methylase
MDFDLQLTGFPAEELLRLLDAQPVAGRTDPDDVPKPPDDPVTRPGDLWLLGRRRLLCGDSAKPEGVDRLLDGAAIHLVHTDSLYNVKVESRSHGAIAAGLNSLAGFGASGRGPDVLGRPGKASPAGRKLRAKDRPLTNDSVCDDVYDRLLRAWFGSVARVLSPGRAFYIWGGYANLGKYPAHLKAQGLYFSQAIVWDKEHPVLTHKDFMGYFEIAFYGWKAPPINSLGRPTP